MLSYDNLYKKLLWLSMTRAVLNSNMSIWCCFWYLALCVWTPQHWAAITTSELHSDTSSRLARTYYARKFFRDELTSGLSWFLVSFVFLHDIYAQRTQEAPIFTLNKLLPFSNPVGSFSWPKNKLWSFFGALWGTITTTRMYMISIQLYPWHLFQNQHA